MSGLDDVRLEIPMAGDQLVVIVARDSQVVELFLDADQAFALAGKLSAAARTLDPALAAVQPTPPSTGEPAPTRLDSSRAKELVPCPHCGRRYVAGTGLGGHIRRAHRGWSDQPAPEPVEPPPAPPVEPEVEVEAQAPEPITDTRVRRLLADLTKPSTNGYEPETETEAPPAPRYHRLQDERPGNVFVCECGYQTDPCATRTDARQALGDHIDQATGVNA